MQPGKAVHSAIREAINASRSASSWARESSFSADFSVTTGSKISMLFISSRRARICRAQDGAQEPFPSGQRCGLQVERLHVVQQIQHGGVDPIVIGGRGKDQVAAAEHLGDHRGDMCAGNIIDGDVFTPASAKREVRIFTAFSVSPYMEP